MNGAKIPRMIPEGQVTKLLSRLKAGERQVLDELIPLFYDTLRRTARMRLSRERREHTLSPTALVHESYVRLLENRQIHAENRAEFLAVASHTMRRVLIDYARTRKRLKRGEGAEAVPFDEVEGLLSDTEADEVLAIEDALDRLAAVNERAAQVIEHRFFGGLSLDETAGVLNVSKKTIQRDWLAGRAWLRKEVAAIGLGGRVIDTGEIK
jgi:RNA polymerase sigma factor (TIGR02999 family)